jgi:hypothetical protein
LLTFSLLLLFGWRTALSWPAGRSAATRNWADEGGLSSVSFLLEGHSVPLIQALHGRQLASLKRPAGRRLYGVCPDWLAGAFRI